MNHRVHLEPLKTILNDVSWPELESLNLYIFVWIPIFKWLKGHKAFSIRSKCKAFDCSCGRFAILILGRHEVSLLDLKLLYIPIINSVRLKEIRLAYDHIPLIELSLNFLNRSSLKLHALQMCFNFVIVKSDDFHWIII